MADKMLTELVRKAISGDEEAFDRVCEVKVRDILYISIKIMGNRQDGEDAAQEILLHVQKHIGALRDPVAFDAWLHRIIRSKCLNMMRDKHRKVIPQGDGESDIKEDRSDFLPDDYVLDHEKKEKLIMVIDDLPVLCKMCVYMFYYEGLSYEEIAYALGITKKDVDNTLVKSKKLIRRQLNMDEKHYHAYVAAPLPVIAMVLQENAGQLVTEQNAAVFLQAFRQVSLSGGTAAVGKAATEGLSGSTGAASGAAVKITLGLALAAGVAAGAIHLSRQEPEDPEPDHRYASGEEVRPEKTEEETSLEDPDAETEEAERDIHTLSDMIGEEYEEVLIRYRNEGLNSMAEMEAYLDEIGAGLEESIWKPEQAEQDSLYILVKSDKKLMVITRYHTEDKKAELVYRFTDINEASPRAIEISLRFDRWK